jgi:hypothetical protein
MTFSRKRIAQSVLTDFYLHLASGGGFATDLKEEWAAIKLTRVACPTTLAGDLRYEDGLEMPLP